MNIRCFRKLCFLKQTLDLATNNNTIFGGISIILIVDPGQLLPVGGSSQAFENAIRIFNDNDSVDQYNVEKLIDLKTPITEAKNSAAAEFGGLVNSIHLYVGCNVTLISNTWIKKGS